MTPTDLSTLSLTDLRDRLRQQAGQITGGNTVDLSDALSYLLKLPDGRHSAESVEALVYLGRNFQFAAKPEKALRAAERATTIAVALNHRPLQYATIGAEGVALGELGRFSEAFLKLGEAWSIAREVLDAEREIWVIGNIGVVCCGMGHFQVAARYFEKARGLAEKSGHEDLEFHSRGNLADCALQLRDPLTGIQALSRFWTKRPQNKLDTFLLANTHNTLVRLHLMLGNVPVAKKHAHKSVRLAELAQVERTTQFAKAAMGLVAIYSGEIQKGLSAVTDVLASAKNGDQTDVPDHLGTCIDAYEAAGYYEDALSYLQQLIDWKKKWVDVALLQTSFDVELPASPNSGDWSDRGLLEKSHSLQSGINIRIRRLLDAAIDAEIGSGYDHYRTFRVGKLCSRLAASVGWSDERIAALALGARLCNIGMMAIPARVSLKPAPLTRAETLVMRDHALYGAELLRRAKLKRLDVPSVMAEQHHERYDGSGYPRGLHGQDIAAEARILAICDAFDAMTQVRPWRTNPLSKQQALEELSRGEGRQFDPYFSRAFKDLLQHDFARLETSEDFLFEEADEFEYIRVRTHLENLARS